MGNTSSEMHALLIFHNRTYQKVKKHMSIVKEFLHSTTVEPLQQKCQRLKQQVKLKEFIDVWKPVQVLSFHSIISIVFWHMINLSFQIPKLVKGTNKKRNAPGKKKKIRFYISEIIISQPLHHLSEISVWAPNSTLPPSEYFL